MICKRGQKFGGVLTLDLEVVLILEEGAGRRKARGYIYTSAR
jgi:hypothetical protein